MRAVKGKNLLFALAGLCVGFLIGFALANSLGVRPRPVPDQPVGPATRDAGLLSREEIERAVARADAEPDNVELQRSLGRALHLYSVETNSPEALAAAVRLLRRAHDIGADQTDDLLALANALFDSGRLYDRAQLAEARSLYQRVLARKPNDAELIARVGWTFYFERPPKIAEAERAFRSALEAAPTQESALQGMIVALIAAEDFERAQKYLTELERANRLNPALPDLRALWEVRRNRSAERRATASLDSANDTRTR